MIGLVLVSHGQLAVEFRAALEHVVGPQLQLETVTIEPEDDMEIRRQDIMAAGTRACTRLPITRGRRWLCPDRNSHPRFSNDRTFRHRCNTRSSTRGSTRCTTLSITGLR